MDHIPETSPAPQGPTDIASSATTFDTAAVPVTPPAPPVSTLRKIFFGAFGFRAGWSLLIYFGIVFTCVMGVRILQHHNKKAHHGQPAATASNSAKAPATTTAPKPDEPSKLFGGIVAETVAFAIFFLLSWLMAKIERRKLSAFGLGGSHSVGRFLMGAFWGLVAMGFFIAILHFDHLLVFDGRLDFGVAILGWGALQLLMFFLVGLTEEYVFRGYIQFTLTRGMVSIGNLISPKHARAIGFWIASFITSAIFYRAHTGNEGETTFGLITVFLAGVLFVVALWRTGSLWWAIGFHMAWDWSQSFLYGVPDSGGLVQGRLFATHAIGNPLLSGGTDGPEGSLFAIPIMIFIIIVLLFTHSSPQPPLETKPAAAIPEPPPPILPLETVS